jgi:hypothetical protein
LSDDFLPDHPWGYRVPNSALELFLGCPVYWRNATPEEIAAFARRPKPQNSILDLMDPAKRPPRLRRRPRAAARRLRVPGQTKKGK